MDVLPQIGYVLTEPTPLDYIFHDVEGVFEEWAACAAVEHMTGETLAAAIPADPFLVLAGYETTTMMLPTQQGQQASLSTLAMGVLA